MTHNPALIDILEKQDLNLVEIPEGRGKALGDGWNKWSGEKNKHEIREDHDYVIMCGETSDGEVVLDHDESFSLDYANEIIPDILDKTLVVKSGDGTHVHVKTTGGILKSFDLWRGDEKLEIKGQGKYVVGPSCEHWDRKDKNSPWFKTGKRYEVISNTTKIMSMDREDLMNRILSKGWGKKGSKNSTISGTKYLNDAQYGTNYYDYDELLQGGFERGERRKKQKSLYCKMRFRGFSENETTEKVTGVMKTCKPQLEDSEVEQNNQYAENYFHGVYAEYVENSKNQNDVEYIELGSLTEIEKAEHARRTVKVKAVIASNSIAYNVPKEFDAQCTTPDKHVCKEQQEPIHTKLSYKKMAEFVDIKTENRGSKLIGLVKCNFSKNCSIKKSNEKTTTLEKFKIRPIISSLYKKEKEFFDDDGNKWCSYDIFVENNKNTIKIEAGREIEISGIVMADPKNQKVTLFANSMTVLNENEFDSEKVRQLQEKFQARTVTENMDWLTTEFEKYSKIIKRRNVAETGFLTFFSPLYINFEDTNIPSWLKSTIEGDSTTGKSETIRKLIVLLKAGQIVSGEMATVAGLAGASVQASGGQWYVDFGVLPMQDRKLLAVDGAHKLQASELDKLAESERNGKIEIVKASKGEAYTRTRQIKIMNPVDEDRTTTVSMDSFFHPVDCLKNNFQIQSIARIDFACFVSDDVGAAERNVRYDSGYDLALDDMSELLRLVWSMKYTVKFTDESLQEILKRATELENKFKTEHVPLITNDQKYKLAKLSASLACLTCSFNDTFDVVTVTDEHVRYVADLIDREYSKAGLDEIVRKTRHHRVDLEVLYNVVHDVGNKINDDDKESVINVLLWLAETGKFSKDELKEQFDLTRDSQLNPLLGYLADEKIIKRTKTGFTVLKYGIEIGRFIVDSRHSSHSSDTKTDTPLNNTTENKLGVSLSDSLDALERRKIKDFRCKTCKSHWRKTESTLETIQEQHNSGAVNDHVIEEVMQ